MGVTFGMLAAAEQQVVTISIPGLSRDRADELAAALNAIVAEFNASHATGSPHLDSATS
jgi:hypothetical protein